MFNSEMSCEQQNNDKLSPRHALILRFALPVPLNRYFDYLPPEQFTAEEASRLTKGLRALLPFGRRQLVGFLIETSQTAYVPQQQLKRVIAFLDEAPLLSPRLVQLLEWTSQYYHEPLGEVFATALPSLLRRISKTKKRRTRTSLAAALEKAYADTQANTPLVLNTQQQEALHQVSQSFGQFKVFLLQGVTGSGKTEVYLQLIQQLIAAGKQTLLLVPEISLTPQTLSRLQQRLAVPLAVLHSGLTDRKRLDHWEWAQTGQVPVVVGTRSAVFTPLFSPGMIIIDEEHDNAFRQQDGLNYHARDVAIVRARFEHIPIVLGSATPALETVWNADSNRYRRLSLAQRAGNSVTPVIRIVDMRCSDPIKSGLSQSLLDKMQQHLSAQGQVLLFLNRRGFAPLYLCQGCGWIAPCTQCDSSLRFHRYPDTLRCHHCGSYREIPSICPECQQPQLFGLGEGTQKLEQTLKECFPAINCIRIDTDSTRLKGQLSELLAKINKLQPLILIGTQMLAKGHHFPGVTLSAVIDADAGLFSSDFRALERSAQLIIQVAGRSGRQSMQGEVIVQTYHPEHPVLQQLVQKGYEGFSELALAERRTADWPPFSYLALLRAKARTERQAIDFLKQVKQQLADKLPPTISLWGPVPALMTRRAGHYRAQLLFQAKERALLHQGLNNIRQYLDSLRQAYVTWTLEVDPLELN